MMPADNRCMLIALALNYFHYFFCNTKNITIMKTLEMLFFTGFQRHIFVIPGDNVTIYRVRIQGGGK